MKNLANRLNKISLVVSDLSTTGANRWGGAVRPFLLGQALQNLGYNVEILGLAFSDFSPSNTDIPLIAIPCQPNAGFGKAIKQLLSKIDGDLIYAVKPKPSSFGVALIKKLLTKRPLLLDIDDWELSWYGGDQWRYRPSLPQLARDLLKKNGALRYLDHPVYLQWLEKLVNYADGITTHNDFLQRRFGGIYIPNGKDTQLFNPELYDCATSKAKYGLSEYKILMFPGAPRPYKGVEDVLIALDYLNREDLRLVIVGGSPYDDYDQQLLKNWGRWLIKLPKSPYQFMPEIVAAADIIVVPQKDTPAACAQFPLKLTDGMAMAKPVLATRVGDIPKIIADTGYLVTPDSPQEIALTITDILANPEQAQAKGWRARQRCLQEYSLEKMSAILAPIINAYF
ncbi:MAG: glycosyltransferase [Gloeocapsa sp. DLM2.Bin57]|nr:MAG: glycosyltransferase [Gloeocapsa sp. DLM2.Bin57]